MAFAEGESLVQAATRLSRGQLLDLVLEIEDRLKQLVRAVFSSDQRDWEALIAASTREDLELRRSRQSSIGHRFKEDRSDLLDYADLGQLIGIVQNQWKLFAPLLSEKGVVDTKLNDLRNWRNNLAHGIQPSPDDKARIVLLTEELGRTIPLLALTR